jgi:peptide/nickel transport system substrate-binding protein
MRRRTLLKAAATGLTGLPRFSIAQPANTRVLRFVPQANLTLLDPIITTAAVTANHAWMSMGYAVWSECRPTAEAADGGRLHGNQPMDGLICSGCATG